MHHNLVPTFGNVQDQFVNIRDKTRPKESILKSNLVENERNLQILSRDHERFAEQVKHNDGDILFRMLYLNISAVYRDPI